MENIQNKKIVVVKIGSDVVTTDRNKADTSRLSELADQVRLLTRNGYGVVLAVSGAVACGKGVLGEKSGGGSGEMLAGVGQVQLISELHKAFGAQKMEIAQFLLNASDLENDAVRQRLEKTIRACLKLEIIPVLNENDAVGLNSFGGNDWLAAKISKLLSASELLLLTNVDALYAVDFKNKKFQELKEVLHIDESIHGAALSTGSVSGIGGMSSKIKAAEYLQPAGIKTILANGRDKDILIRLLLDREKLGTHFIPYQNHA